MKKTIRKERDCIFRFCLFIISAFYCSVQISLAQGTWTQVTHLCPDSCGGGMLLLSDGTVLVKTQSGGSDGVGNLYDKLTPDAHGSYILGSWSQIAPMQDTRLYYSSQVLKNGNVYVAGGEYGSGGANGEVYDPLTNTWTSTPQTGLDVLDANSEILPDGRVLQALVGAFTKTKIYNPVTNTYGNVINTQNSFDESAWVKLPDNSILYVDFQRTTTERFIPSSHQWISDSNVPLPLYDSIIGETGPAFLLPDGRAIFFGSNGHSAYYTPSGNINPGSWVAGPDIPLNNGMPDAAGAMMVNGKILMAVAPAPAVGDTFASPTNFYVFDYLTNSYTHVNSPNGTVSLNQPSYVTNMLDLPDGRILYSDLGSRRYYVFTPTGTPLTSGKPTIANIRQVGCATYEITGTLFNGISEGACYGDDWQMATNYPLVRLRSGINTFYTRTYNWSNTGVQTGNLSDTAFFTLPQNLISGTYLLEVTANGISSDPDTFITGGPTLSSSIAPTSICSSDTFSYSPTCDSANAVFTWTRPVISGISNAGITTPQSVNPNEVLINTTSASVNVVYNYSVSLNGCSSLQNVTVAVNPIPVLSINGIVAICQGDTTTLQVSGATNYLWSNGDTGNVVRLFPDSTELFYVNGTSSSGCAGADSQLIVVSVCTEIKSVSEKNNHVIIYPNPFTTSCFIESDIKNGEFNLKISDCSGRIIFDGKNKTGKFQIERDNLENGIYIYSLSADDIEINHGKLIIE